MDIRFYNFDFQLLYILPEYTAKTGYKSIHTTKEMNGNGSFEIIFLDNDLKEIIEQNADSLIITWDDFQGFVTSYRWDKELRITGMHLNGLPHRVVVPLKENTSSDAGSLIRETVEKHILWLKYEEKTVFANVITFSTDKYKHADEYIQEILKLDNAGYQIKADIMNKVYVIEFIKIKENSLTLSEGNLNAYDFEITYINKEMAFGGWYEKDGVWEYVSINNTKSGLHKIDTVLNAKNETEAINELKMLKSKNEIVTKTKNIKYSVDYNLGDIVNVRNGSANVKKLVAGISKWKEKDYGEEPILKEVISYE